MDIDRRVGTSKKADAGFGISTGLNAATART
jgi:hypothetical protein